MIYDILATKGPVKVLNMAIKQRQYNKNLIHHSDRGLQSYSTEYQKILEKKDIRSSVTESYDPYADAIAESQWYT